MLHMLFYMLGAHWRGEYSLPRAFWVNALGALIMTQTLIASVPLLLAYALHEDIWRVENSSAAAVLKLALPAYTLVWAAVGVWRSAENYGRDVHNLALWPMLARIIVICGGGAGLVYLYFRLIPVLQWIMLIFAEKHPV